jgi:hypothetical protein
MTATTSDVNAQSAQIQELENAHDLHHHGGTLQRTHAEHTCMQEDRERQPTEQETGFEMTELVADL